MKIHKYKVINKGSVLASLDIEIDALGLTIRSCTIFQKGDHRWINFPSKKTQGDDGSDHYYSYVFMEKHKKDAFDKAVFALVDAMPAEEPKAEPEMFEECPF